MHAPLSMGGASTAATWRLHRTLPPSCMQRAMEKDMDTFFDFSSVRRFEREMDQEMRAMDEQMGALQRRLDEDLARSMRELQQAPPGVRIERSEQRSPGSYRCDGCSHALGAATAGVHRLGGHSTMPAAGAWLHAYQECCLPGWLQGRALAPVCGTAPRFPHSPCAVAPLVPCSAAARRYYESISIHSGPMATLVPAHATAPSLFNPLLLAALVLTGAWAAVTAAFSRNYDLTVYSPRSRWQLLLLWPVLLANKRFRHQFTAALRGESAKATQDGAVGPPSSGSSS